MLPTITILHDLYNSTFRGIFANVKSEKQIYIVSNQNGELDQEIQKAAHDQLTPIKGR